jgi:hypothetical protein
MGRRGRRCLLTKSWAPAFITSTATSSPTSPVEAITRKRGLSAAQCAIAPIVFREQFSIR